MKELIKNIFYYLFVIFSLPLILIIEILGLCGFILIKHSILSNKNQLETFINVNFIGNKYPDRSFVFASLVISPFLWLGIVGTFKLF